MKQKDKENLFTLGAILTAAAEICLRDSDLQHHLHVKPGAKYVLTNLLHAMESVRHWMGRMSEVIIANDKDSADVYDTQYYNANNLVQLAMMYCDITNGANPTSDEDCRKMVQTLLNLALKAGAQPFSQELIKKYEPKV